MLWLKSFHLLSMVSWFAGLFYLPRLYVYHSVAQDAIGRERFIVMERKLFWAIMTPAAALTLGSGLWLWLGYGFAGRWLQWKLLLVALLVGYHLWCHRQMVVLRGESRVHGHVYYRWMNEVPLALLAGILILAVVKPL